MNDIEVSTQSKSGSAITADKPEESEPAHTKDCISSVLLRDRIETALGRLAKGTRQKYLEALNRWAAWYATWPPPASIGALLDCPTAARPSWWDALAQLLRAGPLAAGAIVEAYANACYNLAPATIAQRVAGLRWAFRLAREAGLVNWQLHVRGPKVRPYRDTRGPGVDAFRAMLGIADCLSGAIGARDGILLGLLFTMGLRRAEVGTLTVGDFDPTRCTLLVVGKGAGEKEPLTVPGALATRLSSYLALRGDPAVDEPLLRSYDKAKKGTGAFTANGLYRRVRYLARRAGVSGRVSPHGLRHSGITAALDALGGDVRRVGSFARHRRAETTLRYDDRRRDVAGEVAAVLARVAGLAPEADEHGNAHSRAHLPDV